MTHPTLFYTISVGFSPLPISPKTFIGCENDANNTTLFTSLTGKGRCIMPNLVKDQYRHLDNIGTTIVIIDPDQTVGMINRMGCRLLGYPQEQVLGKNWFDHFVPKTIRQAAKDDFTQLMVGATEPAAYLETPVINARREERIVTWHITVLKNDGGGTIGALVSGEDITDRKLMEAALRDKNETHRSILETSLDGFLAVDTKGKLLDVNNRYTQQSGYSRDELLNMRIPDLEAIESPADTSARIQRIIETGGDQFESVHRRKDGSLWHVEVNVIYLAANGGIFYSFLRDITARKQLEIERNIAAVAFEAGESMIITDADGVILRVNKAFTESTGYMPEEIIGQTPRLLKSGRHGPDFYKEMWATIHRTGTWQGEIMDRRKNGEIYHKLLTISAVKTDNDIVTHYVGTHVDISSSKAAAAEIERLAFYDPLTGLSNRRLLHDRLKRALSSSHRSGLKGALLYIDLDNFKTLNDTLGHDMGDLLLLQVAERLTDCVREGDTVARLGGDEFVVMLENFSEHNFDAATQTKTIGEKILARLNQPYQLDQHTYHSTPSIGAVLFSHLDHNADALLKHADIAMYQAKSSGRNALRFYHPQMQTDLSVRIALEADLRHAQPEHQLELYYQPQVDHNRRIIGAEALLRWRHPIHGVISPANFMPLAEETGLILPIGQWVLETACIQLKTWERSAHTRHLQLAVNISARQFHQANFVAQVKQALRHSVINPNRLKLELTETLVVDDLNDTIIKMNTLREIGIHFALDDFGTGYSSLSSLKKLPIDQLKIDQSFIGDITNNPDDEIIVQTIIAMAKKLGMEVIAEGVETEAQRVFLERQGCPLFQGYLFSQPLPITQFDLLLAH